MKRLSSIIKMRSDLKYKRIEEEKYSIGNIRTPEKFFQTFGIHVETQTVENHLCWFVSGLMQDKFLPALREDGMGLDYGKITYEFKDPAPDQP
jgi:hypothetical protein